MKTAAQLDREIREIAADVSVDGAGHRKALRRRAGEITGSMATSMPRFAFIAHWLTAVTRKKENRGPLGLFVRRAGKKWQVRSPVGGGTTTFETGDPAMLYDYVRRGQLGSDVRDAEHFRVAAFEAQAARR